MDIRVKGRNFHVTEPLKEYANEKMSRLPHFLDGLIKADVELSIEKNPRIQKNQVAEVTIFTHGPVVRGRESAPDMYAAIDLVLAKIERQVKRYKNRHYDTPKVRRATTRKMEIASEVPPDVGLDGEEEATSIVKTKRIDVKPMSAGEATAQMELLGHDFFVFRNSDTEEVNVVYRRRQGDYGLIQPAG
jgi:putative sigma-54 modulation protein